MKEQTPTATIAAWRSAYKAVNKQEPDKLTHEDGEYFFMGRRFNASQADVQQWTKKLRERL